MSGDSNHRESGAGVNADSYEGSLSASDLVEILQSRFDDLQCVETWGELALFYNPASALKRGTYFATIKQRDGENDAASRLNREGVHRLNLRVGKQKFQELFGDIPERPPKGGIVSGNWDFTRLDTMTPHPVYGWMGWVAILNPSSRSMSSAHTLLQASYENAVLGFRKRAKRSPNRRS